MEDKEVDDLISGYEDSQGCVNYEGMLYLHYNII